MRVSTLKRIVVALFLIAFLSEEIYAHPWKPGHYVIIDTDCGLDDFRAINLLLSSLHVRVLAIITSTGVIPAEDGYLKVSDLLQTYYHEGIPVGINNTFYHTAKDCKPARDFKWGKDIQNNKLDYKLYTEVMNRVLENHNGKVTFISLGSLNTVASCLKNCPLFLEKVEEIMWACNHQDLESSFNYQLDIDAYGEVINSGVNFSVLNGDVGLNYEKEFIGNIGNVNTKYAEGFKKSLEMQGSPFALKIYDEVVPVYFEDENLFICDTLSEDIKNYRFNNDADGFKQGILGMLTNDIEIQNQVLSVFPLDTSGYAPDIQEMVLPTIEKYGKEEWISCVLTSELHRHLGVYALIGAKMGIRAREYFGAGVDEMKVVTYAGSVPPFSCLNDGLQVSTGATVGHGLITIVDSLHLPKADFFYLGEKITISLKNEYKTKIASEIKELSFIYGLDNDIYWDLVRALAIKYWKKMDRHEVFEIKEY